MAKTTGNSRLVGAVTRLGKQRQITATVMDVLGSRCSVRLSGRGAPLHGLSYVGAAPRAGDIVSVDYQSGTPIVRTNNNHVLEDIETAVNTAVAKQSSAPVFIPPPAAQDLPVISLSVQDGLTSVDNVLQVQFPAGSVEDELDGVVRVSFPTPPEGHGHKTDRWDGLTGEDTFVLSEVYEGILRVSIGGITEDPNNYALSLDGTELVLTFLLPEDMLVIADGWLPGAAVGSGSGGGGYEETTVPEVDPTSITGCIAWFDADQDVNVDGDAIASWTDRSAVANHAVQATGAAKPTFRENIFNDKPALFFDNADYLTLGANITTGTPSIFIVQSKWAKNSYACILSIQKFSVYGYLNSTVAWGLYNTGDRHAGAILNYIPAILEIYYNTTTDIKFFTNGQKHTTSGGTSHATATSRIGSDSAGGSQCHFGYISEVIIFDNIISNANQLRLRKWLAYKWGIPGVTGV